MTMATAKAKKKKAAKKTQVTATRKGAKKVKAAPAPKAAKKAKAVPARQAAKKAKAKGAPARTRAPKRSAAPPVAATRKVPATKKTPGVKVAAPAGPSVARAVPVQRRDHAGHIDPTYAAELLGMSEPKEQDPLAFIERSRSRDDLVEELGEEFVQEATSGEYKAEDVLNAEVPEEVGGPFVETAAATEFAEGTDASNPSSATREPFPST